MVNGAGYEQNLWLFQDWAGGKTQSKSQLDQRDQVKGNRAGVKWHMITTGTGAEI